MSRFDHYSALPFLPEETEFNKVNALWLAEFAGLAYLDEAAIQNEIDGTQNKPFQFVEFGSRNSTQYFVAVSDGAVIVVFRGTENPKRIIEVAREKDSVALWNVFKAVMPDILVDANVVLHGLGQENGTPLGSVHQGFSDGLDEVWDDVRRCIESKVKENPDRKVWFTGHSLGAALATLAAFRFRPSGGVYTFGSPRVGDESFKDAFHRRVRVSFRIQNDRDIVTRLPTSPGRLDRIISFGPFSAGLPGYKHVDFLKFLDQAGQFNDSGQERSELELWTFLFQTLSSRQPPPIPLEMLADHDIDMYIEKIKRLP